MPLDLGILVSGQGTNLQAILDAVAAGRLEARIRAVVSNKAGVLALDRAARAGVPGIVLEGTAHATRDAYDAALADCLEAHGVTFVALAGFLRVLTPTFLRRFPGRVVNIHPALLPAFPGLHGPKQAVEHGAKVAGCTVHFVDEGVDTGPIIAQACLAVVDGDTPETLHHRIQVLERRLYPAVLQALAEGRVDIEGRRVRVRGEHAVGDFVASMRI
jgi:phosphoribosylglycinamide formyltransferase-1